MMDKNAIKKYAIWARRELIEQVKLRAATFGVTAENAGDPNADFVGERLFTNREKELRGKLIKAVKDFGFERVMEEAAYTWFNRFTALRFMEVNNYLPSGVRVFTSEDGKFKPQILDEAFQLDLEGIDQDELYRLSAPDKREELYRYLLLKVCYSLSAILPGVFERIDDYLELLIPDYLLREESVVGRMVLDIPEEDWNNQVQIVGWLYQYYNTEPKDQVFADLKKNVKISKENIPVATQLFTPDWIVRYLVENSLGRLWLEGRPNDALKEGWKYYLDEAPQTPEVESQLAAIRREYAALNPVDIRVIDPCMGSGHILCVLFDVLVQIYESCGYTKREAASLIVEKNLWGLDIDDRAGQLAYFSVMMKACKCDKLFFKRGVQPHVFAIQESDKLRDVYLHARDELSLDKDQLATLDYLIDAFEDAKWYGSILQLEDRDYQGLKDAWNQILQTPAPSLWHDALAHPVARLIEQAIALSQKYHVVATNPPYMGSAGMGAKLADYVKKYFPNSKSDLFSAFLENGFSMLAPNGFESMITMESWMFLSSFEKLRTRITETKTIYSLIHMPYLGKGGTSLGINFGTDMAVIRNSWIKSYVGAYDRISYYETNDEGIPNEFPVHNGYFKHITQDNFSKIPGSPVAYWASEKIFGAFQRNPTLGDLADSKQGLITADNDRFLRLWHEVGISKVCFDADSRESAVASRAKWFPYNKGGESRKWYGNNDYLVNWENDGFEICNFTDEKGKLRSRPQNLDFFFRECGSWSLITSGVSSFRYKPKGHIFGVAGSSFFTSDCLLYLLAFCNTKIAISLLRIIAPTINFTNGDVAKIPIALEGVFKSQVEAIAKENIAISKSDWDSFETSWDFAEHPFITHSRDVAEENEDGGRLIEVTFERWQKAAEERFRKLRENEEELNRIFIEIYGLQDELTPEVEEKDVTVRRADLGRDVRSFISYAVGCMFGRYSLDAPGLAFAGGAWDEAKYRRFKPDPDNIVPIFDDEYSDDDIVARFAEFVKVAFGAGTLEANLKFVADALGGKGSARDVLRSYFLNEFYADHLKIYQKRPIYWLFDSGKKNGFKCLIYLHRYAPDLLSRIRSDYVHELQSRYWTATETLQKQVAALGDKASTSERVKLSKRLESLRAQTEELRVFEEKVHHLADRRIELDLDDGVKRNYELFGDVLAKIK